VFGTKGLRIVDGSVLQQKHVSINDVTCRMLGTFAGDMIKEDWAHLESSSLPPTIDSIFNYDNKQSKAY